MFTFAISCSQDSDILGGDFDSVETSIPLISRYYVNLYVFKFYNSDDVFFKCTVKLCPSGSSDCEIVSTVLILQFIIILKRYIFV